MSSFAAVVHPPSLMVREDRSVPVLVVPPDLRFEDLRTWFRAQLPEHLHAINGRIARLDIGARPVVLFDLRRLIHFLKREFQVEVAGLYLQQDAIQRFAERELKLKLFPLKSVFQLEEDATEEVEAHSAPVLLPDPVPVTPVPVEPDPVLDAIPPAPARDDGSRRTKTVQRTLRSGASIAFDGDVQIFGDVNPGAQVIATGNIVVLGALKGVAHAGAAGESGAFIMAFELRPTQLRISSKIAIPPKRRPSAALSPEVARIIDDQVHIEPYRGRSRS